MILCRGSFRTMARCRMHISGAVKSFLKSWGASIKPQATSVKRDKIVTILNQVYVLKTGSTERYK